MADTEEIIRREVLKANIDLIAKLYDYPCQSERKLLPSLFKLMAEFKYRYELELEQYESEVNNSH